MFYLNVLLLSFAAVLLHIYWGVTKKRSCCRKNRDIPEYDRTLRILLWDEDRVGAHDSLGKVVLDLKKLGASGIYEDVRPFLFSLLSFFFALCWLRLSPLNWAVVRSLSSGWRTVGRRPSTSPLFSALEGKRRNNHCALICSTMPLAFAVGFRSFYL